MPAFGSIQTKSHIFLRLVFKNLNSRYSTKFGEHIKGKT